MRRFDPNESLLPVGLRSPVSGAINRLDFGTIGVTADQITVGMWCRRIGTVGGNFPLWQLGDGNASNAGGIVLRQQTSDQLRLLIAQTSLLDFTVNNFFGTLFLPVFIAFSYDVNATVRAHVYQGTQSCFVEECAYGTANSGSGTRSTSASVAWGIFGTAGASAAPLFDVFWTGAWSRVLSRDELEEVQFVPRRRRSQQIHSLIPDKRALCLDESGYAHHGTPSNDATNPMQATSGLGYLTPLNRRMWWDVGSSVVSSNHFRRSLTTRTGSRAA